MSVGNRNHITWYIVANWNQDRHVLSTGSYCLLVLRNRYVNCPFYAMFLWISLVIWATELDTSLSSSICQPASINKSNSGNRARYGFIEVDISTGLDELIDLGKPSSIWINLVFWATELDTSLSSSVCQPASICRYRARDLSLFRGDKVKMVMELDHLSSSVFQETKKWKLKQ